MRIWLLFLLIIIHVIPVSAQYSNAYKKKFPQSSSRDTVNPDYTFQLGTQVGSGFNHTTWFNTYFAPSVNFNLTRKLTVNAGIGVSTTQLYHLPFYSESGDLTRTNGSVNSIFAYASGNYQLNPKFNLLASALVEKNYLNFSQNNLNFEKQFHEMTIGFNYNIAPHVSFNAQVGFSNRPMYLNRGFSSQFYPTSFFLEPAY